jgi:hypothetical protein
MITLEKIKVFDSFNGDMTLISEQIESIRINYLKITSGY